MLFPNTSWGEDAELEAVRKIDASMEDNGADLADIFGVDLCSQMRPRVKLPLLRAQRSMRMLVLEAR
jgi:hypothetical protein